ncbi:MAG: TIGR01440 family protein [Clostridia bacterium]|nr:TIGR01440 family protein [Clostridia bacterium]
MSIKNECIDVVTELCQLAKLKRGDILVVGCSTSEVVGSRIGTNSDPDTAKEIFDGIYSVLKPLGIYLAVQCCEHLNRAIVTEKACVPFSEVVNVVPQKKAGGSLATYAYSQFDEPVVIEEIKADCGLDIGLTLIGMHLKKVAVPLRLSTNKIGNALFTCARTRPKFIGGIRAIYNEDML